jgi:hypothetical protein
MDLRRSLVKCKFLLSAFALLPISLFGQVAKPAAADTAPEFARYEIFAGADYSSANQAKSSSALVGFNVGADAKLKKWFGGVVDFGQYGDSHGLVTPTVTTFMAGPEFYIPSDRITGFLHVMFGGEHTGNAGETPDISFAYAVGGGIEYALKKHWAVRVSGDDVLSSFVQSYGTPGESPHTRANARASGGVAYRF